MTNPIEKHWRGIPYNDAENLEVKIIKRAEVAEGQPYAQAVVVHLLTAAENNYGNHNAYFDVIDEKNQQIRGSLIRGDNNGIRLAARIDKPPHEFGTNFALHGQDTVSCWVSSTPLTGDIASDIVSGLHTRWGGEKVGGQNYGHVSFYIIWRITTSGTPPIPPVVEPPPIGDRYEEGYKAGRRAMADAVMELINKVGK